MENENGADNKDELLSTIDFINAVNAHELINGIVRIDNITKEGQKKQNQKGAQTPKRDNRDLASANDNNKLSNNY